jgi:TolB-like protein/Tfp pilus assembly protein PilF
MVVLNAPAGDEAPILLRNFLKSEQPSLLVCRNLSSAQVIVPNAAEGMACLICSDKPVSPAGGILPGKGIENLTDLNLQINESLAAIQPKRLALDILSDVLLRHKALQTRKWLNELLERLRARGITTLAVLNPYMHSLEETQAVADLFDGDMEVLEKNVEGKPRNFLQIKWMHGIEVGEKELPLTGLTDISAKETFSSAGPTLDKLRVAVLPLKNMSPNPNDEYFADGMTEELITSLSGVRQLTIIARTSVMKYKGSEKSASDVGKELNVGSMIEGSVRKAGNRVRITAQLIDTSTEGHMWAQHYDRQLDDVFAIQSEIAEKVAGELKIRLVDSEKRVITKKATENTEAYTCFLRGRELAREETEPSLRQAVGLFEKAVELDPSFARAYVGLADCFLALANDAYEPYEQSVPKAELAVKKALKLDPELAEATVTLALIHFLGDDIVASESEARRATELNPSLPEAYRILSNVASLKGDGDEGIRLWEAAYRLDPIRPRYIERLGSFYFYMGRESEALQFWEKTAQLASAGTYRNMTEYYLSKGNHEKAKEFFSMAEKIEPTNSWVAWMRGFIAARTGDRNTALEAIRKIEENWSGSLDLNGIGFVYYALGDFDSYFTYINRAEQQHLLQSWYPMYCPLFAKGRTDPRYQGLLEKIKEMSKPKTKSS